MTEVIEFANRYAPDRITITGVLAVRCLRYVNETATAPLKTLPNLHMNSTRSEEQPVFHESTGLYGFLKLQPGTHRVIINDPGQRYLPRAIQVDVPDRSSVRANLEKGGLPSPGSAGPLYTDAAMRPSVNYPLLPGESAIWGQVSDSNGRPLAFSRLQLATRHDDGDTHVVSYSDMSGTYLLRLSGERASFVVPEDIDADGVPDTSGELTTTFDRELSVHSLKQNPFGLENPLDVFPVNFDSLDPDDPAGPYQLESFSLYNPATDEQRLPVGAVMPRPSIQVGRRIRWDIILT
ncbi:MAG: hypothetical protein LC541_01800 [Candidatus Thiodiazotropha sp.]|nr:hypothetical protein [Candidatus Thiodiazotropha sp.]